MQFIKFWSNGIRAAFEAAWKEFKASLKSRWQAWKLLRLISDPKPVSGFTLAKFMSVEPSHVEELPRRLSSSR